MFVHPNTHHFGRTYTGQNPSVYPTTGRKNLNKENAGALPSKTPSRVTAKGMMVPSTSIRVGLGVKSTVKDGNLQQTREGEGKGKGKEEDIGPKRLFTSQGTSSKSALPPSKSLSSLAHITSHPTRTPAARRQVNNTLRTPAPPVFEPPTPLPSASRTRRRSRASLTPLKADPVEFKTPARSAKWEEEVSLGSIEVGVELEELVEVDEGDGDDEVEYMPPPMPELPLEAPFEHADVREAFGLLVNMPPLWRFGEGMKEMPEPELDFEPEQNVRLCDDDMLEEPLFRTAKPAESEVVPTRLSAKPAATGAFTCRLPAASTPATSKSAAPEASRAPVTAAAKAARPAGPASRTAPATAQKPSASTTTRSVVSRPIAPSSNMSSARQATTRVPQTAYLAKPRAGVSAPSAAKPVPSSTSRGRAPVPSRATVGKTATPQTDLRPIIQIDVPMLEIEDEPMFTVDEEFDLGLSSDDESAAVQSSKQSDGQGQIGQDVPDREATAV